MKWILFNANLNVPALELVAIAQAVRTELASELSRVDASISSRLASASYTAPDNASVTAIKAKTDNLPVSPASEATVAARPTLSQIEASTVLAKEGTLTSLSTYAETKLLTPCGLDTAWSFCCLDIEGIPRYQSQIKLGLSLHRYNDRRTNLKCESVLHS
jgi:hypothetical protein